MERTGQGFAEERCLPFLTAAQNPDGGWGYRPRSASAVEPTAWCVLTLGRLEAAADACERGREWLIRTQSEAGWWSTRPETAPGNWLTALAGLALAATGGPQEAIARAAGWVCESRSSEGGLRTRLAGLLSRKAAVQQDVTLRGWSWTQGTSSWVEPTAVSLIFLRQLSPDSIPREAVRRQRMGEAMLYNRMCPGGGWNSGNPRVYGVAGIPQVGPTAWALVALQEYASREENRQSLDWLVENYHWIAGASSMALAQIALEASGRRADSVGERLNTQLAADDFLENVISFAQAAFALAQGPDVLRWPRVKGLE